MPFPLRFSAIRALVKEINVAGGAGKPLAVGGARELAAVLRRELGRDAAPGAVRADDAPAGAAALVYVLAREPTDEDEAALMRARRSRVPVVVVAVGGVAADVSLPFVLATDLVRVGAGEGFPLELIAKTVAGRLGEEAAPLAARVPLFRRAVGDELVATFARKNGLTGAAVFIAGADLPVLTLNQIRLLLRLEQAYGRPVELGPTVAAAIGAGIGLRTVARRLVGGVALPEWAVKAAVAYAGTRAVGEAARTALDRGATRPQAGASRAAP
jgi:uncharacterized protein (DUF697 family)